MHVRACERVRAHLCKFMRNRTRTRWRDELDDYWNGTIWHRIAQNRQMWKQLDDEDDYDDDDNDDDDDE